MEQALDVHRFHFAFTVTFHYIFPQLTMGLEASRQPAYATRVAWGRRALGRELTLGIGGYYGPTGLGLPSDCGRLGRHF